MSVPSVTPDAGAVVTDTPAKPRRGGGKPPGSQSGFVFPTLFMLAFIIYFLMPLWWLFVASTKSLDNLFDSFGLWANQGTYAFLILLVYLSFCSIC